MPGGTVAYWMPGGTATGGGAPNWRWAAPIGSAGGPATGGHGSRWSAIGAGHATSAGGPAASARGHAGCSSGGGPAGGGASCTDGMWCTGGLDWIVVDELDDEIAGGGLLATGAFACC